MSRKGGGRGRDLVRGSTNKDKGGVEHFGTTMIKSSGNDVGPSGWVATETEQ
jgi:hypothetical protein